MLITVRLVTNAGNVINAVDEPNDQCCDRSL